MLDVPTRVRPVLQRGAARVHALGRFRLTREDGRAIPVRSRKARALLAYLALTGKTALRGEIAALLWSDRGEEQARASLRQTLHELRRLDWTGGESPLLADGETLSLSPGALTHDLAAMRAAAEADDLGTLTELLNDAAPDGALLADLDGIDRELDQWLRQFRAREPGDTIDAVQAAADRAVAGGRHHEAKALLAALEACEPTREDIARLQFRVARALHDDHMAARRWDRLVAALDSELGTRPSPATEQAYRALAAPETSPPPSPPGAVSAVPRAVGRSRAGLPLLIGLSLLLLLLAGLAAAWWWSARPAIAPDRPVVVAVVPFEARPGTLDFLAAGLWEDTRTALARNPGLRLLGRATSDANGSARLTPAEWRRRTGADYLLGGYLDQRAGKVSVTAELTRTADGLVIWQGRFEAPAGEPASGQSSIASAIEGQLRSRLAPGGGRLAEQITTSSDVQALYGESAILLGGRRYEDHARARGLLLEAVRRDPQYAPAWAALAQAAIFTNAGVVDNAALREESLRASRRALQLAPNLAKAHAVAGLLMGDDTAAARAHLRRAIALDPSDVDAWNWLGNSLARDGDPELSMTAYRTATGLDPLYTPALMNLAQTAGDLDRPDEIDRLAAASRRAGAGPDILAALAAYRALADNDLSQAAKALARGGKDDEGRARPASFMPWILTLQRLDMLEPLHRIVGCPRWYPALMRGQSMPPAAIDGRKVTPEEFWLSFYYSYAAARALYNHGETERLVTLYRQAFGTADRFLAEARRAQQLSSTAPTLAMALLAQRQPAEARYILAGAERDLDKPGRRAWQRDDLADLAAIKAAQGEHQEALALLGRAVDRKWLPDGRAKPIDLRQEPAFAKLRGDPRFDALRSRILATVTRERAETGSLPL
ncbi:BTAD domain-containing putative transcriptional regulator [Sphingomonas astaxanthinifaciens]|uniref:Bacterial transcriptional activator domain-containing protein n=1 Tax=Sphingomonas astaxanthinifaciens DSM 22298 TaxID=1123267 RepID=A0ABQ5Z757_9SPHN|nr:tetratricopeptide repeat protein [Sphingomonas astaxanthinifaciens]GLR47251.1 hypothetical protein GCM10007925_09620 [Sphingomonas astaxanthinifaciens DSM 22298]